MQMATRYPIPGTLSTCADFIIDSSNIMMSVDLFNKANAFIDFSTILKIFTDLDNSLWIAYTVFHQNNYTSHILVLDIKQN